MEYCFNGIKKEIEIKDEDLERYGKCHECGKASSWVGKLYWYNGKLYCKDCLIQKLLEDKAIYDNLYSNF